MKTIWTWEEIEHILREHTPEWEWGVCDCEYDFEANITKWLAHIKELLEYDS